MSLLLITAETLARAAMDGWASLKRQAARRRTVVALSALDGRTLTDIGLCRGEILSVAYGTCVERRRGPWHE
jgi:uncharacterized protein YjiS (DUF1127 family)